MQQFDVIILGAGAAGLLCAIEAGKRGRRVLVLDHADRAGKKILISGGGRSNFTNLHCTSDNFLSENPHFAKSPLARFTPEDMVALVEKHSIPYHEKTLGQLFCDRSSRDLVSMLERECDSANVRLQLETTVHCVERARGTQQDGFTLQSSHGVLQAQSVVVATGGLSIPKMGATGFGYELARQFGLRIVPCRPGLVPFTFAPEDREAWCDLAGVSAEAVVRLGPPPGQSSTVPRPQPPTQTRTLRSRTSAAQRFREKILITHRGLSGPATLQISSFWTGGEPIEVDLAPDLNLFAPLLAPHAQRDSGAALQAIRTLLPSRWAERWLSLHAGQSGAMKSGNGDLTNASIAALESQLHAWQVMPAGTEGYSKAEVTVGGVDTSELDARTMEAKRVPGLFFIGEVVDVTGWLGGFNFQWAWASGFSAGQVV